jgi:5'-3' exonuclease
LRERPAFNTRQHETSKYCMLEIGELRKSILSNFAVNSNASEEQRLADMVMLTTFVGNDFLPPLSHLKIKDDGLDLLYKSYNSVVEACGGSACLVDVESAAVNWMLINALFKDLAKGEDTRLGDAHTAFVSRKAPPPRHATTPLQKKEHELDYYTVMHNKQVNIDYGKATWTQDYYAALFPAQHDIVEASCSMYADGIVWIAEYYLKGKEAPHSGWYYQYAYGPTIKDISNNLTMRMHGGNEKSNVFQRLELSPEEQLLVVLPPDSIRKFAKKNACIVSDPEHGCMDMYPVRFRIHSYLKTHTWECVPVLPPVDTGRIKAYLARNHEKVTVT